MLDAINFSLREAIQFYNGLQHGNMAAVHYALSVANRVYPIVQ